MSKVTRKYIVTPRKVVKNQYSEEERYDTTVDLIFWIFKWGW